VDEGRWFGMAEARLYMRADQRPFLDRLEAGLG
jgi:predicted NUDIX family NTP pyrophosphohydrolase